MVDGKANTNQDNRNDTLISGLLNSIKVGIPNQTNVAISHDDGANWNVNTNRSSIFKVGWNYNNVRGRDSDNSSIKTYGRHFKKINEPLLTTNEDCENYANRYLSVYKDGIDKGSIVVRNKPDLDITSKFRLSSNTMGIDDVYSVVEYTQTIDQNGYNTSISYGESPYNIAQEVARLKSKVD
jgi:hypothetical protein